MAEPPPPLPIGGFHGDARAAQEPADVAVVMPTILRPQLRRALEAVYAQTFEGRVQLAIGVDVADGDPALLTGLLDERPENFSALVVTLPFSTSQRHGGVHSPMDGGALRAILSLAANARRIAYLDDDNEWLPRHLELLMRAVEGRAWAFSHRMLVDEVTDADLAVDIWDSVGVGKGRFASTGGMVDPNCLLVDKVLLAHRLGAWAQTPRMEKNVAADRIFFRSIAAADHGEVKEATVRYRIRRINVIHEYLKEGSNSSEAMAAAGRRAAVRLNQSALIEARQKAEANAGEQRDDGP